jgi:hypothetical protein
MRPSEGDGPISGFLHVPGARPLDYSSTISYAALVRWGKQG